MIDDALLDRLRQVESGGGRYLRSPAGALGPYQFMPATAAQYGIDPMNEEQSRAAARKMLTERLQARGGNLALALADYNWGQGNVDKWQKSGADPRRMPRETQQYIQKMGAPMPFEYDPLALSLTGPMPSRQRALADAARGQTDSSLQNSASMVPPAARRAPLNTQATDYRQQASGLSEEAFGALEAPVDLAAWQDYAKQRSAQGNKQLLLALAAQEAGKEFAPISAMYLKQAQSARDPLQIGKAGMITGEGQFMEDPFYKREEQANMKLRRAQHLESLAQNADTAEARAIAAEQAAQARAEAQAAARALREEQMGFRRDQADYRRTQDAERQQNERFRQGNTLRDDFGKWTEKAREGQRAAQQIAQIVPKNVAEMNAQQQQATVFAFMRMLDPGSVVRESEYALAERGRGVIDSLLNYRNQLAEGKKLTEKQITNMAALARELDAANEEIITKKAREYQAMGRAQGIPAMFITPGYGEIQDAPAAPAGPAQGAVRLKEAPGAAPAASPAGGPPPGAVRLKGQ